MPQGFDMFRKSHARREVGVDAKTLENMGLTFFQLGGCIFGSKNDFETLIRTKGKRLSKETESAKQNASKIAAEAVGEFDGRSEFIPKKGRS